MIVFFGAGVIIFLLIFYFIIATAISDGIVTFINNNITVIVIIFSIIYIINLLIIFHLQKQDYKKISWLTPIVSLPSFAQLFYFFIYGAIAISKQNVIFSFFLIACYILWIIVNGFATFVAQTCCIGLPTLHNKYTATSEKLLIVGLPIVISIIGIAINNAIF